MKVNLKEKKLGLGKCKFAVDFGRCKITFIFMNLRGLKIKIKLKIKMMKIMLSRGHILDKPFHIYGCTSIIKHIAVRRPALAAFR